MDDPRRGRRFRLMLDAPAPMPNGHAVQVRLYAEDPALDYRPTTGTLTNVVFPDDIRAETWVMAGSNVSAWYGSHARQADRPRPPAARMRSWQCRMRWPPAGSDGIETNLRWLRDVLFEERFIQRRRDDAAACQRATPACQHSG